MTDTTVAGGTGAVKRRCDNEPFLGWGVSFGAAVSALYGSGRATGEKMMMWRTLAVIGAAVMGSGAIAAEQDRALDIRVEQIVYRNDTIVAAPSIRFVAGKTASFDTGDRSIRLKTMIRSEPSAASVAVSTTASWLEDGKEVKPETTEFVGGIGSGNTKTWQGKDGTVYRLVTNISVATKPRDAAPRP